MNQISSLIKIVTSKQFIVFFISGVLAFLFDFGVLTVLYYLLGIRGFFSIEFMGITFDLTHANLISVFLGSIFSYYLQARFAFSNTAKKTKGEKSRYFVVVIFNYIVQNLLFGLFVVRFAIPAFIAKFFLVAFQMIWSFLLYKHFVFKK